VSKHPKAKGGLPVARKVPREAAVVPSDQYPTWRFSRLDFGGPLCPTRVNGAALTQMAQKLGHYESQTWDQLKQGGSHHVEVNKLEKFARDRLRELKLDDLPALYSLRLSGTNRVWGIRSGNALAVLWVDPDHQVCPAHLKHT
jgi:hypothetical protein